MRNRPTSAPDVHPLNKRATAMTGIIIPIEVITIRIMNHPITFIEKYLALLALLMFTK